MNIIAILHSVVISGTWTLSDVVSWVDRLLAEIEKPRKWLCDVSMCTSAEACAHEIGAAMRDLGQMFPDDIGELLAGLILLRYDRREISEADARRLLVDVLDAPGVSYMDIEGGKNVNLDDEIFSSSRNYAVRALVYLQQDKALRTNPLLAA